MIYFDCAATTVQKPERVARKMKWASSHMGSPGRGGHDLAELAAETAFTCRERAAQLFNVADPAQIAFTSNATHGLNIAIKTLAHRGDRVLISGYEHNSVVRPLYAVGADILVAKSELFEPEAAFAAFERKIDSGVKLVVCNHVSNVFGFVLPIERIARLCKERGIPFIIDASQSAGVEEIDFRSLGADFIAMPGHKGLYGPQGTGLLICKNNAAPIFEGGTGSMSASRQMPDFLPDMLEAGTHNMPGIAGLSEGIAFVLEKLPTGIKRKEKDLLELLTSGLGGVRDVRTYEAEHHFCQNAVLSFTIPGMDPELVGQKLADRGIAVRAGLHCSPLAHESAGTEKTGTVRMSISYFNKKREIYAFLDAIQNIIREKNR